MTLQQFRYIIALAQHGSFAKAAEICGITQPTLSKMVSNLEEELDVRLFDRSGRRVTHTALGLSSKGGDGGRTHSATRGRDTRYRIGDDAAVGGTEHRTIHIARIHQGIRHAIPRRGTDYRGDAPRQHA